MKNRKKRGVNTSKKTRTNIDYPKESAFLDDILNSVVLVKDDFLRFLLLALILLVFASTETALLLGCSYGLRVLGLLILFLFSAILFWTRTIVKYGRRTRRW